MNYRTLNREDLIFKDLKKRFFINEETTIVVFESKKKKVIGHVQWHIHNNTCYMMMLTDHDVNGCSNNVQHALAGNFLSIQNNKITTGTNTTWRECKVSGFEFIGNEKVSEFIGDRSLEALFNEQKACIITTS